MSHSKVRFSGYLRCFPGVRRPGPEASQLAQCSTELKNEWSHIYTSIWLYTVQRNKFTLPSLLDLRLGRGDGLSFHHDIVFIFNLHDEGYVGPQSHVSYIKYRISFLVEDIKHFLERVIYFERDRLIGIVLVQSHRLWKMTVLFFIGLIHSSFRSATAVSLLKWRLFILHLSREKEKCHEVLLLLPS